MKCTPIKYLVVSYGILPDHNCIIEFRLKSKWDFVMLTNKVLVQKKPVSLYFTLEEFKTNFKEVEK